MTESTDGKRILVVDDDQSLLRMIEQMLTAGGYAVELCSSFEAAKHRLTHSPPDVLLLDLAMPRMSGLVALREMHGTPTRTRIILVTASIDRTEIITALQLGAQGVVLKDSASEVLFKSIRAVMAGEYWVGRKRVADLAAALRDLAASHPRQSRKQFGLTPRELEIIGVILGGYSNSDIAAKVAISEKTVKHHLTNIFDKLGVSNRLELALFALHHNLAPEPVPAETQHSR